VPTRSLSQSASAGREGRRSARLAASARSCLRCVAHDLGRVFHVAFAGTLDIATTLQADRTLRATQADAQLVILDLRQVQFIGSTAARVAGMADARARRAGSRLVVVAAKAPASRPFALARLNRRLGIVEQCPRTRREGEPA
jgi:anti-anti-sigma factor